MFFCTCELERSRHFFVIITGYDVVNLRLTNCYFFRWHSPVEFWSLFLTSCGVGGGFSSDVVFLDAFLHLTLVSIWRLRQSTECMTFRAVFFCQIFYYYLLLSTIVCLQIFILFTQYCILIFIVYHWAQFEILYIFGVMKTGIVCCAMNWMSPR